MNRMHSKRTLDYLRKDEEIKNTSYGRKNRNIKNKDLMINKAKLNLSKCSDTFFAPFKYPLTMVLLCSTISMGMYIATVNYLEAKKDYKFFTALENDHLIPKETMLRVQKHYYNNK